MRVRVYGILLLCAVLASSPALAAATVTPLGGQVLINRGQGYQPVTGPIEANPGDSLMVPAGGAATVLYPDGCSANVRPGDVVSIGTVSPCVNPYTQQDPTPTQHTDFPTWAALGLGVAAAAGVGVGIYEISKSSPASP